MMDCSLKKWSFAALLTEIGQISAPTEREAREIVEAYMRGLRQSVMTKILALEPCMNEDELPSA